MPASPGSWAGGWPVSTYVESAEFAKGVGAIYDVTLGAPAASIDVTGIIDDYAHLQIVAYLRGTAVATNTGLLLRLNNDSGATYDWQRHAGQGAAAGIAETFGATSIEAGIIAADSAGANLFTQTVIDIAHYAGATNNKTVTASTAFKRGVATTDMAAWDNAAINRVTLFPGGSSFAAGSCLTVYVKGA